MRRMVYSLLAAISIFAAAHPAAAQKLLPKSIEFQGDPEYSDAELVATAGLKRGEILDYAAMPNYSRRLLATGVFATVAFKLDGEDVIFMLTPADDLLPVRIENLPLTPGKDLEQRIHELVPLYHGKVPAEGGLADDVGAALQKMLASEGLQVTVTATTAVDPSTQEVKAVSYAITSLPVKVGVASVEGVSDEFQSQVQTVLTEAARNPFSTTDSAVNLKRALEQFYSDRGYAAAKIEVALFGNPRIESRAIVVPFAIQVKEGLPARR